MGNAVWRNWVVLLHFITMWAHENNNCLIDWSGIFVLFLNKVCLQNCAYNPFPHFEGKKHTHRQSQGEENRREAITTGQSVLPFWPIKDPGHVVK